jgi:plasmid segregation protein ParM
MDEIRALGFNSDLTQYVFIGGGASIMKHFLPASEKTNALILDNVYINAKGYEDLIRHKMGGRA